MKKTIMQMKDVIVLDKNAQKKIQGGLKHCTYSWQDAGGAWHTEDGFCDVDPKSSNLLRHYFNASIGAFFGAGTDFCRTASHRSASPLTSNGGESRC